MVLDMQTEKAAFEQRKLLDRIIKTDVKAFKSELNMQVHLCMMMLVILCGIVFEISATEWQTCIVLFGVVIAAEIFNTAIETTVDIAMPDINEKAKYAKDIAAGAVLFSAMISVIIGLIIFLPKIFG